MPPASQDVRHLQFLASNVILALLATIFVIARGISKHMKKCGWAWDDIFVTIALLFHYICVAGSICASAIAQGGRPFGTATGDHSKKTLIILWALQFPQPFAMTAVRIAICMFLIRIFFSHLTQFTIFRRTAQAYIILALAWLLAMVIGNLLHCYPISYNWRLPIRDTRGHCLDFKPYAIVMAAWGLVIDTATWSLPHFVVWRLRLRRAHKVAITAIFALGLLNIMIAVFRIISLMGVAWRRDTTRSIASTTLWANAQASTAIMLACCPLLRPVFEKIMPRKLTRRIRTTTRRSDKYIHVTTRILIFPENSVFRSQAFGHDSILATDGPTFEVERQQHRVRSPPCPCCRP